VEISPAVRGFALEFYFSASVEKKLGGLQTILPDYRH
jgi:hypothetical protein